MRPIINSEKRIVQTTKTTTMQGAVQTITYVNANQSPTGGNPNQVAVGTVVKAIYCEVWINGDGAQPPTVTVTLEKLIGDSSFPDFASMANLNVYTNKKNILECHQGLVGDSNANPVPFFRHWVKIPKGKQRFGNGDKLVLTISAITENIEMCGLAIFKAYN